MNTKLTIAVIALAWLTGANRTTAQGTAFAYQGQLQNNGNPASGTYNFTFSLYNTASGGPVVAGPVSTNGVVVTNGLFQVSLDFGASVWNGQTNWLQISVATNGSPTITALTPLQQIAPVPQAIFATTASNLLGTLPAAQVSGTVPLAQLPAGVVINNASGVALTGTFNGNGTGLTSVNAAQLNGLNALNFWQLGGNTVSATQILGSTNNQPLAIVAGGQLAGLITAAAGGPEIIWGISNSITSGSPPGASILGGSNNTMSGTANYAVIAGGQNNSLGYSYDAVIGGGYSNRVGQASYDVVGGGIQNIIGTSSSWGFIGGGELNVIGANTPGAVVGGGDNNTNNGNYSFLGGGNLNTMGNSASYGSLGGGANNLVNGNYATVPGGNNNVASGKYGFAAGYNAQATNQGAFVWADSQSAPFASTNNDSFNVRARGGVHLVTSGGGLTVDATVTATNFIGNAAGLTNLPAAQLTGNIPVASLPADLVTNTESGVTLNNLNLGGTLTLPPPATIFSGPATAFYADDDNVYAGLGAGVISPAELDNTAIGAKAMGGATIDSGAVAIGYAALQADQAGTSVLLPNGQTIINPGQNTAIGFKSLQANTIGTSNTAVGYNTLNSNVAGARNTAVGDGALNVNNNSDNTAVGAQALAANTTGTQNTANGEGALQGNTTGFYNTASGLGALSSNSGGIANAAVGADSLQNLSSGYQNTAVGSFAFQNLTNGAGNIGLGYNAGHDLANGNNNIYIGTSGFPDTSSESGIIRIGDVNVHTNMFLTGDVGINTYQTGLFLNIIGTFAPRAALEVDSSSYLEAAIRAYANEGDGVQGNSLSGAGVTGNSVTGAGVAIGSGSFRVIGANYQTNTTAFIQTCNSQNVYVTGSGDFAVNVGTAINNPICNGNANVLLMVTYNNYVSYGDGKSFGDPVGVGFDGPSQEWVIYDLNIKNGGYMPLGTVFNVLIIVP